MKTLSSCSVFLLFSWSDTCEWSPKDKPDEGCFMLRIIIWPQFAETSVFHPTCRFVGTQMGEVSIRESLQVIKARTCVCCFTAAGSRVIHIGRDSSRTYVRHTIQIHISVTVVSDMRDVTALWNVVSSGGSSDVTQQKEKKAGLFPNSGFPAVCVSR